MTEQDKKTQEIEKKLFVNIEPLRIKYENIFPDLKILVPNIDVGFINQIHADIRARFIPIENLQKQLQEIANVQKIVSESLLASLRPSLQMWAEWGKIYGRFARQLSFLSEADYKKFEYNWADILDFQEKRELYEAWKKGEEEKIKELLTKKFSDLGILKIVLDEIKENPLFVDRIENIQDAFDAHLQGKYTLSIPVLLAQIDGVFIEIHKDFEGKLFFTCPQCRYKTSQPLNAKNISEHLSAKHDPLIKTLMSFTNDIFDEFRNDIQHGKKKKYADKFLSTKLILILLQLYLDDELKETKKE